MRHSDMILLLGAVIFALPGCFSFSDLSATFTDDERDAAPDSGDGGLKCTTDRDCPNTHYCQGTKCVPKKSNGEDCSEAIECRSGYCDEICCEPGGPCCREQDDCSGTTPICSTDNQCVGCDVQDSCNAQYPALPGCNTDDGTCVECVTNEHCRRDVDVVDGGVPNLSSPLGLCTPDNVCTCWVEEEDGSCPDTDYCVDRLGSEFYCATDYSDGLHGVCLRTCSIDALTSGISCADKTTAELGTAKVWVPTSTCYAFNKYLEGQTCSTCADGDCVCSVFDLADRDGRCDLVDSELKCSFSCTSNNECPQGSTCSTWCQ